MRSRLKYIFKRVLRYGFRSLVALGCVCFYAGSAYGVDQQITSTFWAEGYSVPARDGSHISRRNIVEDLHLAAWNLLPGSDDPYYKGPHLSIELNFRLNGDYGVTNPERNASNVSTYVPGLTPLQMEAVFAYLDARGFWNGALDVRAGRQVRLDTVGFFAFDGIESAVHLPYGLGVSLFVGYQVQGGTPLGYDSLELDGIDNSGRDGVDELEYPDLTDPSPQLSFGTELSWTPARWFDTALAVRLVGLNGRIHAKTVAARFVVGNKRIRTHGRIVMNPYFDRRDSFAGALEQGTLVTSAEASLGVAVTNTGWLSLEYDLYRPVFDADSIFNVFDVLPKRDLGLRFEHHLGRTLSIAGWTFVRMADESGGLDGAHEDGVISGLGGGTGANYYSNSKQFSTRLSAHKEWGESRMGVEVGGRRGFRHERMWLGLRGSYWHIDDSFSSLLSGNVIGYVASISFKIAQMATLLGEFENYYGGGRDPRFTALALLRLDLWR